MRISGSILVAWLLVALGCSSATNPNVKSTIGEGAPDAGLADAAPAPAPFDLLAWGTFSRATEGSFVLGALDDGTTPSLGWAQHDVQRVDWRTGAPMLLLEGARTNALYSSENFRLPGGGWGANPSIPVTRDYYPTPDGTPIANIRVQDPNALGGQGTSLTIPPNVDWSAFAYVRAPSGTSAFQMDIGGGAKNVNFGTATTTWARAGMALLPGNAFTTEEFRVSDGRDLTSYGGAPAGPRDAVYWGLQLEQASFSSSYIRTRQVQGGASTDRAADIKAGPMAEVPSYFVSGVHTFDVMMVGSAARMARQGTEQVIFAYADDDSELLSFVIENGAVHLRVTSGDAMQVESDALAFDADQVLHVTVDSIGGTITVDGASSGNGVSTGSPWTRVTGSTLYVGNNRAQTKAAFVALDVLAPAASNTKRVLIVALGQSNMIQYFIADQIQARAAEAWPLAKQIGYQQGSTSLAVDWAKGGDAYVAAVAELQAAYAADPTLASYTPIIIWGQGESDAYGGSGYWNEYLANLHTFFANLEADVPQLVGARKVLHQLHAGTDSQWGTPTAIATIRAAQAAFVAEDPAMRALVDPSDLPLLQPQGLHYTEATTNAMALRDKAAIQGLNP